MARFGWVPFYDSTWVSYVLTECIHTWGHLLPFVDGHAPHHRHENVSWGDIAGRDVLFLAAHGRKWTTDSVAWKKEDGTLAYWTVQSFAQAVYDRLDGSSGLELDYRLVACFGANNITPFAQ